MESRQLICVKIGGKAVTSDSIFDELIVELRALTDRFRFIIIHGGGAEVSRVSRRFGIEPSFVNGVRQTSREEMETVDMVLSGSVNKSIVRRLAGTGLPAVGISGSDGATFVGQRRGSESYTGSITAVEPRLVRLLIGEGFVPVVSSTSMETTGRALNINADEAAFAIASALPSKVLVFISDIPGVMKGGKVVVRMDPSAAHESIADGTVTGGMIPKIESSLRALQEGVSRIVIGGYERKGDLYALIDGSIGTTITEGAEQDEQDS